MELTISFHKWAYCRWEIVTDSDWYVTDMWLIVVSDGLDVLLQTWQAALQHSVCPLRCGGQAIRWVSIQRFLRLSKLVCFAVFLMMQTCFIFFLLVFWVYLLFFVSVFARCFKSIPEASIQTASGCCKFGSKLGHPHARYASWPNRLEWPCTSMDSQDLYEYRVIWDQNREFFLIHSKSVSYFTICSYHVLWYFMIFYDILWCFHKNAFLNVFQRLDGETQMAGPDFVRWKSLGDSTNQYRGTWSNRLGGQWIQFDLWLWCLDATSDIWRISWIKMIWR